VYLFERECSIQRRHQKVIEEAPSCILTEEMRKAMGDAAIKVAKSCTYSGAGTVEFLVDAGMNFYFLEMNTRLQVEHPVTEMITGIDIVEQQIQVARNQALTFTQSDLKINGHALELRVYAEDPKNNFLPSIGKLEIYKLPKLDHVRVDDAYAEGNDIPIYYDPMIAKLSVWAKDRIQAIQLMKEAINDYWIEGVETTLPFGTFVMNHPNFINGNFDTHFVNNFYTKDALLDSQKDTAEIAGMVALNEIILNRNTLLVIPEATDGQSWFDNRK
nr:biotin carboxylase [Saprospiraceae bacterium]